VHVVVSVLPPDGRNPLISGGKVHVQQTFTLFDSAIGYWSCPAPYLDEIPHRQGQFSITDVDQIKAHEYPWPGFPIYFIPPETLTELERMQRMQLILGRRSVFRIALFNDPAYAGILPFSQPFMILAGLDPSNLTTYQGVGWYWRLLGGLSYCQAIWYAQGFSAIPPAVGG
jgi:hypothetical protein